MAGHFYRDEMFAEDSLFGARLQADIAMAQIDANTADEWREIARKAIIALAQMRPSLTSDDVWDYLERVAQMPVHDNRALGPVLSRMHREQLIEPTGHYEPSRRRHCAPIRVWRAS